MRGDRIQFTDAAMRSIKPPAEGYRHIYDTLSPLGLRINAGGARAFFVMVGRGQRQTIGRYPEWDLRTAREEAREIATNQAQGVDTGRTFEEAFAIFLEKKAWGKQRTKKDAERLIRRHFLPKLRSKAHTDIQAADIVGIVDRIEAPSEAAPAYANIRLFFNWCRKRSYVRQSPVEMEAPYQSPARDRVLSDDELQCIWHACELSVGSVLGGRKVPNAGPAGTKRS